MDRGTTKRLTKCVTFPGIKENSQRLTKKATGRHLVKEYKGTQQPRGLPHSSKYARLDHLPKALTLQSVINFNIIQAQLKAPQLASRNGLVGNKSRVARSPYLKHSIKKAKERYTNMGRYSRKTTRVTCLE